MGIFAIGVIVVLIIGAVWAFSPRDMSSHYNAKAAHINEPQAKSDGNSYAASLAGCPSPDEPRQTSAPSGRSRRDLDQGSAAQVDRLQTTARNWRADLVEQARQQQRAEFLRREDAAIRSALEAQAVARAYQHEQHEKWIASLGNKSSFVPNEHDIELGDVYRRNPYSGQWEQD